MSPAAYLPYSQLVILLFAFKGQNCASCKGRGLAPKFFSSKCDLGQFALLPTMVLSTLLSLPYQWWSLIPLVVFSRTIARFLFAGGTMGGELNGSREEHCKKGQKGKKHININRASITDCKV